MLFFVCFHIELTEHVKLGDRLSAPGVCMWVAYSAPLWTWKSSVLVSGRAGLGCQDGVVEVSCVTSLGFHFLILDGK